MHTTQYYDDPDLGSVAFMDMGQHEPSAPAQPRDIVVVGVGGTDFIPPSQILAQLREDIAVDIRAGQGIDLIGIRKNLKQEY